MNQHQINPSARRRTTVQLVIALCAVSALFTGTALAVSSQRFRLDSREQLSGGELDGTMVRSDGRVVRGAATDRIELEGVPIARCVAARGDTLFVGTGQEGKVYRVRGDSAEVFAETGELLVTSCVIHNDTLYAGTIPNGKIFAIDLRSGEAEALPPLAEDVAHIWALATIGDSLYVGTGPNGRVFRISLASRQAELALETSEGHVLSLATDGDTLYAGTDGEALVYSLQDGRVQVVHDFVGNEISALAAQDGVLAIAANVMPAPRRAARNTSTSTPRATAATRRSGDGKLFIRRPDGYIEEVLSDNSEHFPSLMFNGEELLVGTGEKGRILAVDVATREHSVWMDIDERQVQAMALARDNPAFVTGDGGAVYRTSSEPAEAIWRSKVLDAETHARFGQLSWSGQGGLELSTRSGNTEEPDDSWTEWSQAMRSPGPVRSPAARYIQIRARLAEGAELYSAELYYLQRNQPLRVRSISIRGASDAIPNPSTTVRLQWEVWNPDEDTLEYTVRFRRESSDRWRDMLEPGEELRERNYDWDTSGIPDGHYIVEVRATDEPSNPRELALSHTRESERITVDNHAPAVNSLSFRNGRLQGSASDELGPIRRLEYAVNGGPWSLAFPEDGILDEAEEAFAIDIEIDEPGEHLFAVRVTDSAGNTAIRETTGVSGQSTRGRD